MPYYLDQRGGTSLSALQDFAPTGTQAFAAQVGESWEANPSVLGFDAGRVALANRRGERLSAYDAGQIATQAGLRDFAPGDGEYTREALNIIIERKREQRMRQDVIARTPWSLTGTPVRGLGMLAANLLDPANIATAYIPVIGQARYAALLRGAAGAGGRATVRAGVGATEGAIGAALVEPAIIAGRRYLDDDYAMSDSLLNVAFGGALGGGLHVVGGAIGDALAPGRWAATRTIDDAVTGADLPRPRTDRGEPAPGSAADIAARSTPESRQDALRTAIAHMAEGRRPDVETVFYFDPTPGLDAARASDLEAVAREEARTIIAAARGEIGWAEYGGSIISEWAHWQTPGGLDGLDRPQGDVIGRTPWVPKSDLWPNRPNKSLTEARAFEAIDKSLRGEKLTPMERQFVDYVQQDYREKTARFAEDDAERAAIEAEARGVDPNDELAMLASAEDQARALGRVRDAARRVQDAESSITADFAAARAADERLATAPATTDAQAAAGLADAAVERLRATLADLKAAGASDAVLARYTEAMAEADAGVKDAEALGKAVRAAAVCGMRAI